MHCTILCIAKKSVLSPGLFAAVVCSLTLLSGCDQISRPGPGLEAITKRAGDLAGFTLIDVNADTIGPYILARHGDGGGTVGTGYSPRVRLAPGDMIRVNIAESKEGGLFSPLAGSWFSVRRRGPGTSRPRRPFPTRGSFLPRYGSGFTPTISCSISTRLPKGRRSAAWTETGK